MNTGTTIIGIILTLVCIVPFVLFSRKRSTNRKKLLNKLEELAAEKQSTLSGYDILGDMIIGSDNEKQLLYFVIFRSDKSESHCIDLKKIHRSRVVTANSSGASGSSGNTATEQVGILLSHNNPSDPDIFLEFYNSNSGNFTIGPELQLAEKWIHNIESTISLSAGKQKKDHFTGKIL